MASKLYFMTRNPLVVGRVICLPCMECSAQPPADLKTIPALTEFKLCKTHGWLNSASNLSGKKGEKIGWRPSRGWLACYYCTWARPMLFGPSAEPDGEGFGGRARKSAHTLASPLADFRQATAPREMQNRGCQIQMYRRHKRCRTEDAKKAILILTLETDTLHIHAC